MPWPHATSDSVGEFRLWAWTNSSEIVAQDWFFFSALGIWLGWVPEDSKQWRRHQKVDYFFRPWTSRKWKKWCSILLLRDEHGMGFQWCQHIIMEGAWASIQILTLLLSTVCPANTALIYNSWVLYFTFFVRDDIRFTVCARHQEQCFIHSRPSKVDSIVIISSQRIQSVLCG